VEPVPLAAPDESVLPAALPEAPLPVVLLLDAPPVVLPAALPVVPLPVVPAAPADEPGAVLSEEDDEPAVPLPVVPLGAGVVAALDEVLSDEPEGAAVVLSRREQAATDPASATAIRATSNGFAELPGRLDRLDFIVDLHLSERVGHFWRASRSQLSHVVKQLSDTVRSSLYTITSAGG